MGFVLVRSDAGDGGWSLYASGSTDEEIASGEAPPILSGRAYQHPDGEWSRPCRATIWMRPARQSR